MTGKLALDGIKMPSEATVTACVKIVYSLLKIGFYFDAPRTWPQGATP
jgi:hypothetical protein